MVGPEESLGELLVWSAGAGAHPEIVTLRGGATTRAGGGCSGIP
jgi:hypothetical protein